METTSLYNYVYIMAVQRTRGGIGVNGPLFICIPKHWDSSNLYGIVAFTLDLCRYSEIVLTGLILL